MRSALFLDRDGVMIHDSGYAKDPSAVILKHDCASLIKQANQKGWLVVVVTNQSGVGRSIITMDQYKGVTERMLELLASEGGRVDQIYFAPFHKTIESSPYTQEDLEFLTRGVPQMGHWSNEWRKPLPGMVFQAQKSFNVDLRHSIFVGDRHTDYLSAIRAGVGQFVMKHTDVFQEEIGQFRKVQEAHPELVTPLILTDLSAVELL